MGNWYSHGWERELAQLFDIFLFKITFIYLSVLGLSDTWPSHMACGFQERAGSVVVALAGLAAQQHVGS